MKNSIAVATLIALAAASVGAGALDSVPHMFGSDTLKDLTLSVLSNCSALHMLSNPINFDGTGSGNAENNMKVTGAGATQMIGPMSRPLGSGICTAPHNTAEGMVIALDGVAVVVNDNNNSAEGIDYPGTAGNTSNEWRTVLRQIYTGMEPLAGANVFQRDCNSVARKAIVNNWDNVFHGTNNNCTDSHPSVPGVGINGYDQNNAIVEPGIRHAFRRDDASGTTDVFLAQLNLSGINFAQGAPTGANTVQAAVYRGLSGSPFCNNKRPDDDWAPTTLAFNALLGLNSSQIPEMSNVGVPTGAGTGLGFTAMEAGSSNPKFLEPYFNEYSDQDPIRRRCVGRGNNAAANLPMEQVCGPDGSLGVVLPISIPSELTPAQLYPSLPCEPGLGFFNGPAPMRPNGDPVRCPNGDATQDSQCLLPVRSDATQPRGVAFDCINPPANVPQALFDTDGNGSQFPDAPATDGRPDVDGRVYNLILRAVDGTIRTETRADPSKLGSITAPVAGAFWRIHTTRSLGLPPTGQTSNVCATFDDDTDQIGCLTLASPCSIGYAGRGALSNNPGTAGAAINGIPSNVDTIRALVLGGTTPYPIARKLYLNTVAGFENLHNSASTFSPNNIPATDAEEEMAKCYATLPFNGTINVESSSFGFVKLPPHAGASSEQPLCEDFNGMLASCLDATNSDACIGNDAVAGGVIPTSFCNDGLKDGAETAPDVCQAGTTCSGLTHQCQ